MSQFTTPADLRMLADDKWELLSPFSFYVGEPEANEWITVPKGFVTDLASIPRILWPVLPPSGEYAKAAILHDYLYRYGRKGRRYADAVFYEAMGVLGVARWRKWLLYAAVRSFGGAFYKGS